MNGRQPSESLRILLYDPQKKWPFPREWQWNGTQVVAKRVCKRIVKPDINYHALLSVVPSSGFAIDQKRAIETVIENGLLKGGIKFFVSFIEDEELVQISRGTPIYESLYNEIKENYRCVPILFSLQELHKEHVLLDLITEWINIGLSSKEWETLFTCLIQKCHLNPNPTSDTPHSFTALMNKLWQSKHRKWVIETAQLTGQLLKNIFEEHKKCETRWSKLSEELRLRCKRRSRKCTMQGAFASKIIRDFYDSIAKIETTLDKWSAVPFPELDGWVSSVREMLITPGLVVPVVGVFSSGKTTFFNCILDKTEGNHLPLRTAKTHNTALLCSFHYTDDAQRVEFTYRKEIVFDNLCSPVNSTDLAILSPYQGKVQRVQIDPSGFAWIEIALASGKFERIVIEKGEEKELLEKIKRGYKLKRGEKVSTGKDMNAVIKELQNPNTEISLRHRAKMASALLKFIESGHLKNVSFDALYRKRDGRGQYRIIEEKNITKSHPKYTDLLQSIKQYSTWRMGGESLDDIPTETRPALAMFTGKLKENAPVQISLRAKVDSANLPAEHPLISEDDWGWFQGAPDQKEVTVRHRKPGYAESPEVEYLTERADLFLDNLLFKLVALADTPGLNSITPLHDRLTEEYVKKGQGFLFFTRLGRGPCEQATEKTVKMIIRAFKDQGINEVREMGKRVFVALNRFKREAGARTEESAKRRIQEFEKAFMRWGIVDPNIYVIDLSPQALQSGVAERKEEILGKKSLAHMLADLQVFICNHGLLCRVEGQLVALKRIWRDKKKSLERAKRDLTTEAHKKEERIVRGLIKKVQKEGVFNSHLKKAVSQRMKKLRGSVKRLAREIDKPEDKDDFEELLLNGGGCISEYNEERNNLEELPRELNSFLRVELKSSLDSIPTITISKRLFRNLPPIASEHFQSKVRDVIARWPSIVGRFFSFFKNLGQFHYKTAKNSIEMEFLPESKKEEIEEQLKAIENKFYSAIEQTCKKAKDDLSDRLASYGASEIERKKKLTKIEKEHERLHDFAKQYKKMVKVLQETMTDLRRASDGSS